MLDISETREKNLLLNRQGWEDYFTAILTNKRIAYAELGAGWFKSLSIWRTGDQRHAFEVVLKWGPYTHTCSVYELIQNTEIILDGNS